MTLNRYAAKSKTPKPPSELEERLAVQLRAEKIPFQREVTGLVPGRKFRVDFLVCGWLVVECQGGIWKSGKHSNGVGVTRDTEKAAELLLNGYPTIACTMDQIKSGTALEWIKRALSVYGTTRKS